ncbi:MAG TPA: rhamnulokinase family protein [Galbitalea sp.]
MNSGTGAVSVAAVDLGATSGRVMLGRVGPNELQLHPVLRFPNTPIHTETGMHWNIDELYRMVISGLRTALGEERDIRSIGVDSWAVDYALLKDGLTLGPPFHYRDERNLAATEVVHAELSEPALYAANGLQYLPFNTIYQLTADRMSGALAEADRFLLVPDLINFWLGGAMAAERTNASTTGLLDVSTGLWYDEVVAKLELPRSLFPPVVEPGTSLGGLSRAVIGELGGGERVAVNSVGSHDTASAVVAVPSTDADFAYISCGTWGLVGVELETPVLTEASRLAGFTNEGGVDGRIRYLHNVMGLWLLSESVRTWEAEGTVIHLPVLLQQAALVGEPMPVFNANDARFLVPGDMPARIAEWFGERGIRAPQSKSEMVRSIVESLADAFAAAVATATELSGKKVSVIHLVGGGSQNELLCRLTANRSGLPVLAGPVEATAIGNVLVQARAHGSSAVSLEAMRGLVAKTFPPVRYERS